MKQIASNWFRAVYHDRRITFEVKIFFWMLTPLAMIYAKIFGDKELYEKNR